MVRAFRPLALALVGLVMALIVALGLPAFNYSGPAGEGTLATVDLSAKGDVGMMFALSQTASFEAGQQVTGGATFWNHVGDYWFGQSETTPPYPYLMLTVWTGSNQSSERVYQKMWPYTYGDQWGLTVTLYVAPGQYMTLQFEDFTNPSSGNQIRGEYWVP